MKKMFELLKGAWKAGSRFILTGTTFLIIGVWVASLFAKPEIVTNTQTVFVVDSTRLKEQSKYIKTLQTKEVGFVKRILSLEKEVQASQITVGNTDPLDVIIVERVVNDTLVRTTANPYDFIISGKLTKNSIEFTTFNPYLEDIGEHYTKIYKWNRDWDEFEFVAIPTASSNASGIRMFASRDIFSWDGVWGGIGYDFQKPYIYLDARIRFYSIEIKPVLRSTPYLGVEVGVGLF